jgi:hypothetical protein
VVPYAANSDDLTLGTQTLLTFSVGASVSAGASWLAWVTWNDGSALQPVTPVALGDGTFAVLAGHPFGHRGRYAASVTLQDPSNPANAMEEPVPVDVGQALWTVEGQNLLTSKLVETGEFVAAVINDPYGLGASAGFNGTISYGDGTAAADVRFEVDPRTGLLNVIAPSHVYPWAGAYTMTVEVWDTEHPDRVRTVEPWAKVGLWREQTYHRTNDPQRAGLVPLGEASLSPNSGGLRVSDGLDFDVSPGTAVGRDPALVYNSDTVDVRPVLQVELPPLPNLPDGARPQSFRVWLQFDGRPWLETDFSAAGHPADQGYVMAVQVAKQVTATGEYGWLAKVQADYGNHTYLQEQVGGKTAVVVNDNPKAADPLGAGWGLAGVDRLVPTCGPDLVWAYGTGEARLFSPVAPGAKTYRNGEDYGTLKLVQDGGKDYYEYTPGSRLETWRFDGGKDHFGALLWVKDLHQLAVTYSYGTSQADQHQLTQVQTPDGGVTTFTYAGSLG